MTDQVAAFERKTLLPEQDLPRGEELLSAGRRLAGDWQVGSSAFQRKFGFKNEIDYKLAMIDSGRVMQHAHLGLRELSLTVEATKRVYETCFNRGTRIDRFGMCLDWSMGYPRDQRKTRPRGTGILLQEADEFAQLTHATPAAMHFGDFMLGFPAAVENTCAALAAGATTIGNLGQYFTFRLPGYNDDVETTAETVKALGLIAAQDVPVLVHSNLDDGYAAMFEDLTSALGQAILEKYIVSDLIGAPYAVCYGHHFTEPLTRIAFQRALAMISGGVPGSQVYGATVLYKGDHAENYAGLSSYLLADIAAQMLRPTGHAVNPVPVSENERIPDACEIIDAQLHLNRLAELAEGYTPLLDLEKFDQTAEILLCEGQHFADRVLIGLAEIGVDTKDPFELLLVLRRMGGRLLEQKFGAGFQQEGSAKQRRSIVPATTYREIQEEADDFLKSDAGRDLVELAKTQLRILTATTDVHEHGKKLLDTVFAKAGFDLVDGGISSDPDHVVSLAKQNDADVIALSTYNGVALRYAKQLLSEMEQVGHTLPILIGGRLNEIPDGSNSSLPVDVSEELVECGVIPCTDLVEACRNLQLLFRGSM